MRRSLSFAAAATAGGAGLFFLISCAAAPGIAEAYSTTLAYGGGSGITSAPDFQSILAPFENFFRSIGSIGNLPLPTPVVNSPSVPQNPAVAGFIKDLFQKFDAWLYGIAGFHIAGIFTAILDIFSWVLGITKDIVDWFLRILR